MKKLDLKKIGLPDKPGVYFFLGAPKLGEGGKKGKQVIYIGKATSLRSRVKSYFGNELIATRGSMILDMVTQSTGIKWQETDSVLEALILEANLIKKHLPKYNTKEKDNKSFNYVCITRELLPKVLIIRGRNIYREARPHDKVYGPFPNGQQLKVAMSIIRRIFPFIDEQSNKKNNREFYKQLGLVPLGEYKENIKNIKLLFEGKKKSVVINLKKEMFSFASRKEFEKAGEIKKRIFALNHINDVALIKEEIAFPPLLTKEGNEGRFLINSPFRIEAYDIAHMGGQNMVGVMTVIEDGELVKNEYKKFIIRTQNKSNDTGALEEVISRRFRHSEWGLPNIIVMDGSTAQMNVAKRVLSRYQFDIKVVSVVKDDKHKAKAIMGDEKIIKVYKKEILLANNEAHRFAIAFHKKRRNKNFLL